MRKLFLMFLALFLIACNQKGEDSRDTVVTNDSLATARQDRSLGDSIVGQVQVSETDDARFVYIVENWESRSKVSYEVTGDLIDDLAELEGEIIQVKGSIEKTSQWSGSIEVTEIASVE